MKMVHRNLTANLKRYLMIPKLIRM